jgi:hypothetical protein
MKILVTKEEVEKIVLDHLKAKGWPVNHKSTKLGTKTHVEGEYEDSREVFDGITVEVEEEA